MQKLSIASLGLLFATAIAGGSDGFSPPASAQTAACYLYDVNYARRILPATTITATAGTVVSIKNPGTTPVTVEVEWIDTAATTIGLSGPKVIPGQNTFEFATTAAAGFGPDPFIIDVPGLTSGGAALPTFEGSARIYRTDPGCKPNNQLDVNAQVVVGDSSQAEEYIHVNIERPKGSNGE
jgi:hypothetical protein